MSLADTVRKAVALANSITADLQDTVTHRVFTGIDEYGAPSYASPKTYTALVERKLRMVRLTNGRTEQSRATITFLRPTAIDTRDRLTLSDGTTGQILETEGLMDPSTDATFMTVVHLG